MDRCSHRRHPSTRPGADSRRCTGCHRQLSDPATAVLLRQEGYSLIDLLMVVAVIAVIAGMAVPTTGSAVAGHRFRSDAQAVTQMVGLAKMRASAGFTRARVRADTASNSYALEIWDKAANAWVVEGGTMQMSAGVRFGFGTLGTPPPSTQPTIALSPPCRTGVTPASTVIANTHCIVFNSRGLPVDGGGVLFAGHALYLTDGGTVAATTITATPRIRRWVSPSGTANWREQL